MDNSLRLRLAVLGFLQFLAPGVAMWGVAFIGSLFQNGTRVGLIRSIGLDVLLVLAAAGLVKATWTYLSLPRRK
jgi:hypothetical protein